MAQRGGGSLPPSGGTPAGEGAQGLDVLVVDDHRTFAELLCMALEGEPGFRCLGHVQTATDAIDALHRLAPDVVVMDVGLPDLDGLEATRRLVAMRPGLRVVVLTGQQETEFVTRAAAAGACALLPKDGELDRLLHTLRTATLGSLVLAPTTVAAMNARPAEDNGSESAQLTRREREVLDLLGQGLDPSAIARRLRISPHTSRDYVKSLRAKLGARSQLELVAIASQRGLLRRGSDASCMT